ncbi:hypothetical protein BGX34_007423 [Mortierella sp. NVP85]|nr:hypothetical protein BGX34_007423 [Mortierella sp. NVP85]
MELSPVSDGSESSFSRTPSFQLSNNRADQKKAKAISDAIDKSLKADKERQQREGGIKLLILGGGKMGEAYLIED